MPSAIRRGQQWPEGADTFKSKPVRWCKKHSAQYSNSVCPRCQAIPCEGTAS